MLSSINRAISSDADEIELTSFPHNGVPESETYENGKHDGGIESPSARHRRVKTEANEINERRARVWAIILYARHPYFQTFFMNIVRWCLPITAFCFIFPVLVNYGVCQDVYQSVRSSDCKRNDAVFVFGWFLAISFITIVTSTISLVVELSYHIVRPHTLGIMYISTILHYATWYQAYTAGDNAALYVPMHIVNGVSVPMDSSTDLITRMIMFFYFSITVMTTCGYGDITPNFWYIKITSMTQMVVGIFYTVGIFAIGLDHFRSALENRAVLRTRVSEARRMFWTPMVLYIKTNLPRLNYVRILCIRYLFVVTCIIQGILLLFLIAAHGDGDIFESDTASSATHFLCLFFEIIQFAIIVFSSFRLIQSLKASTIGVAFLAQSFLSVCGLFGGIYLTIYLINGRDSFDLRGLNQRDTLPEAFGQFIYFSVVTMTCTGFGDVAPVHAAARVFVSLEIFSSVFFQTVILGLGIARSMHVWKQGVIELPPLPTEDVMEDEALEEYRQEQLGNYQSDVPSPTTENGVANSETSLTPNGTSDDEHSVGITSNDPVIDVPVDEFSYVMPETKETTSETTSP
jgi:hypothetical protein